MGVTYKDSGVDIDAGNEFVKKIGPFVKSTYSNRVITDIGGFGALYSGKFPNMEEPILVSGTDGVGTKIKIAQQMNVHDTIGIDAVAMCVNDILTSGARPLFFLDYMACGKLIPDIHADVVKGIAEGCHQAGCSLVGGETAEHPNVMAEDDYDIGGFSVGVVDRKDVINGSTIAEGDIIIGLPSTGVHSNGFSLVRKILFDIKNYSLDQKFEDLPDTLGNVLLAPTKIYCKSVLACLHNNVKIDGLVHITGGGFYENIPRILPDGVGVKIEKNSYDIPAIFPFIQKEGDVAEREMYTTFNMGIGMMMFVKADQADKALSILNNDEFKEKATVIGHVVKADSDRVVLV